MIENAFKVLKNMTLKDIMLVPISVNVSKSTILRYDFLDKIVKFLDKYGVEAKYIELEITEREEFNDIEKLSKIISVLRSFGIKISIDDFGIGYSNLLVISSLDFDIIKIDKAITNRIGKNEKLDSIFKNIKHVMDEHNILIVAEGIESEDQYLKLLEYGYEYAQGYYFSEPREIENLKIICAKNSIKLSRLKEYKKQ